MAVFCPPWSKTLRQCTVKTGNSTKDSQGMTKVAILGGTGYTAVELIKILLRHPQAELVAVTSRQEGTPLVAELHPSLIGRTNLRCEPFDADRLLARGVQCAF